MFHLLKRLLLAVLLLLSAAANSALATTSIEFYKADIDHYFMTADSAEATSLDNNKSWNWVRTGKTFDVWLTQASAPSNASPVCRFIGVFANGTLGSHFYTIDQAECAYVKSRTDWGWSYEGDAFYAVKPTGGSCPSGTSPVYRAFNNGMGGAPNHRYMASQTDLNTMVSQGWSNEGIVMCSGAPQAPPISVVLYTHIEDNTPMGTLGTDTARTNYLFWRDRLIQMATLAKRYNMVWLLQPDWKILVAAQQYEDASTMASTGGKNILLYLRDNLGVVIDAHSHENGGYNYTDIAYLLTQLGVGGTTVIGGHVWDPTLPQFAHWERFRVPVAGIIFPSATWRGDILIGAGTPSHTNDPIVSGVWRPKDPTNFWVDDPVGNITSVGGYKLDIAGITTLTGLYASGKISTSCMLTSTYHIIPAMIESASTLATLEHDVLQPLDTLRSSGQVEITDFTSLVAKWKNQYASKSCLYQE